MFSHHITNCCNAPPQISRKYRPACGREKMDGCNDGKAFKLQNTILDQIWSKPLWYQKRFEAARNIPGAAKPENFDNYKNIIGITNFFPTDQFCEYSKTVCDLIYTPQAPTLWGKYDPQNKVGELTKKILDNTIEQGKDACAYPNCWISGAETDQASCGNQYYKLIAHYPSVGRPFQSPSSIKSEGLRNSNVTNDIIPGRQTFTEFSIKENNEVDGKLPSIVEGSHRKDLHQNTAYPGKYWISWWNSIHPGNIIGFEGTSDAELFSNPFASGYGPRKLSEQIKIYDQGANPDSYTGAYKGFTFIQQFENQASNEVIKLSTGFRHSCILTKDYKCFCWGDNQYDQSTVPLKYKNGSVPVKDINCGGEFTVVTLFNGSVDGWGRRDTGALAIPTDIHGPTAPAAGVFVKKIAAGGYHVVALMDQDAKRQPNGKTLNTKNTLRAWGDNSYNQTKIPVILKTKGSAEFQDFIYKKNQDTILTRPTSKNGEVQASFDEVYHAGFEKDCILPWWPIISPYIGASDERQFANSDNNLYTYASLYPGGIDALVNEFENTKVPEEDTYPERITTEIEFEDVWAGKYHTVAVPKQTIKVPHKKPNWYLHSTFLDWANNNKDELTTLNGISGWGPNGTLTVVPQTILNSDIQYWASASGVTFSPGLSEDQKDLYRHWQTATRSSASSGTFIPFIGTSSVIESIQPTNIFFWGAGMQGMDHKVSDPLAKESCNFDYEYHARYDRISTDGSRLRNVVVDPDGRYYIKTNSSSYDTIILGYKEGYINKTSTAGGYYVSSWSGTFLQAWGCGLGTKKYLHNPTSFVKRDPAYICGDLRWESPDKFYEYAGLAKIGWVPAFANYHFTGFIVDTANLNFRLNLYKLDAAKFFQFKWNDARIKSTDSFTVCPFGLDYRGWTLGTEQELNDTGFDYSEFNKPSTKNNIIIRTGGKGTYLVEKYVDEWISSLPVERKHNEYPIGESGISNWSTVFSGSTTTNFFEVGDNHVVAISKYYGDGSFFNNPNSILNFPYKLKGESEPRDVTGLGTFISNGITEPTIPVYSGILNNKNETWKQPKFDEETSSRVTLSLNLTVKKTIIKPDGSQDIPSYLTFNTDGKQHFMLVGLRGDQRIKPFTGATCDCMWSDWATDNLKIGGHQGTIINDTTFYAHDKNKAFIPWDKNAKVPDRTYKIDEQGVEKIHYYNAPPNVLTHTLIEIPPGRFPSQLATPCREKFCEGGVNRTIQNWCDPCFGYGIGKTLSKEIGKSIWPGRMGCTGCEYNHNLDACKGCTLQGSQWVCPSNAPKIHDVYGYNNLEYALGTTFVNHKINSFGEFSTPIEEAWPSLNRYLIPRWAPPSVDGIDTKTSWILNSGNIEERTTIDYPLVVVPAHGGDIGPIYDLEAYQDVALSLAVGSLDEYVNKSTSYDAKMKGDRGIGYITDFKDTEYPFYRDSGIYPSFYSPNGSTGSTGSVFYKPPAGVTFNSSNFPDLQPLCGNTETGCSSCSIPFTGAEVASWGFDLHSDSLVNAVQSFLPLSGDAIQDPEIGNINTNGVWLGIAKDRFVGDGESIKNRIRLMFPITLKEGETIKFGTGVAVNNAYSKTILNNVVYELFVSCSLGQYPNDKSKESSTQKYSNYEYRWGRFNDECGCSSRMAISPDIFLADPNTTTLQKLKAGKISELTNKEKASILIGGHETQGLGLLQYWNCTNTVTPLESGQSPHLLINNINVGLSDLTNRKPTFLSNTQGYLGSGADLTTIPMPLTHFYRGDYNLGFIHIGYYPSSIDSTQESNVPIWVGVNSPGIRGIWSGWLSSKGWSNFFTAGGIGSGVDDFKDRVGGDIPLESSHPQGWLGYGSTHPMMRNGHRLGARSGPQYNTQNISSMTDFVNTLRNFDYPANQYSGIPSRRSGIFNTNTGMKSTTTSTGRDPIYSCSGNNHYADGRKHNFDDYILYTRAGTTPFERQINKQSEYQYPENPKTQKLKMCCFGNGFENEVYSSVTKSFIPDIYSKVVKINKYRNLYNAMWHSHPVSLPNIAFRNWHGDPYSPDYCVPGSANCKARYSPVWFEYWYPEKLDNSGSQGGAGRANPFGFNYNKHIKDFRHQRWDLPLFIGANRDNIANFYIHDPNCEIPGQGPEYCSGFELVDTSFPSLPGLVKVGWDHRKYDSIIAQNKLEPNALYFHKTNRGGAASNGFGPLTRGNAIFNSARTADYRYAGTFYTINSDVWSSSLWESCLDYGDGQSTDTWMGLMGGLYGAIFVALAFGEINYCLRSDDSKWNNYFTYMGPGYVVNRGFNTRNAFKASISNISWYNT